MKISDDIKRALQQIDQMAGDQDLDLTHWWGEVRIEVERLSADERVFVLTEVERKYGVRTCDACGGAGGWDAGDDWRGCPQEADCGLCEGRGAVHTR